MQQSCQQDQLCPVDLHIWEQYSLNFTCPEGEECIFSPFYSSCFFSLFFFFSSGRDSRKPLDLDLYPQYFLTQVCVSKYVFYRESAGTGCPERLWLLPLWRWLRPGLGNLIWLRPWAIWSSASSSGGQLCPQQGVGTRGLWGPFQAKTFYDSVIHKIIQVLAFGCLLGKSFGKEYL